MAVLSFLVFGLFISIIYFEMIYYKNDLQQKDDKNETIIKNKKKLK